LHSLWESQIFPHLDEGKDSAARPAGKTLVYLLGWIDIQARAMVVMERAQSHHLPAFSFQADVLADYVNDVARLLNLIDYCLVECSGYCHLPYGLLFASCVWISLPPLIFLPRNTASSSFFTHLDLRAANEVAK
jgi:hypothetical protein